MPEEWILEENLKPFLSLLAFGSGANLDSDDWIAISHGLEKTEVEQSRWFEYELVGSRCKLSFAIAKNPGSSVVFIRIFDPQNLPELKLLFLACQEYRLT